MKRQLFLFSIGAMASLGQALTKSGTVANSTSISTTTVHQVSYVTDKYFEEIIGSFKKGSPVGSKCVSATAGFPVVLVYVTPLDCAPLQPFATKVKTSNNSAKELSEAKTTQSSSNSSSKTVYDGSLTRTSETTQAPPKNKQVASNNNDLDGINNERTTTSKITLTRTEYSCNLGACKSLTYTTVVSAVPTTGFENLQTAAKTSCLLEICQTIMLTSTISKAVNADLNKGCSGCQTIQPVFNQAAPSTTTLFTTDNGSILGLPSLDGKVAGNGLNVLFTEPKVLGGNSISASSWSFSVDLESNTQILSKYNRLFSLDSVAGSQTISIPSTIGAEASARAIATPSIASSTSASTFPTQSAESGTFNKDIPGNNRNGLAGSHSGVSDSLRTIGSFHATTSGPEDSNVSSYQTYSVSTDNLFDSKAVGLYAYNYNRTTNPTDTNIYNWARASATTESNSYSDSISDEKNEIKNEGAGMTTDPYDRSIDGKYSSIEPHNLLGSSGSSGSEVNRKNFKNSSFPINSNHGLEGSNTSQSSLSSQDIQDSPGVYDGPKSQVSVSKESLSIYSSLENLKTSSVSKLHVSTTGIHGAVSNVSFSQPQNQVGAKDRINTPQKTTDSQVAKTHFYSTFTTSPNLSPVTFATEGASLGETTQTQTSPTQSLSKNHRQSYLASQSVSIKSKQTSTFGSAVTSTKKSTSPVTTNRTVPGAKVSSPTIKAAKKPLATYKPKPRPSKKPNRPSSMHITKPPLTQWQSTMLASSNSVNLGSNYHLSSVIYLTPTFRTEYSQSSRFGQSGFKNGSYTRSSESSQKSNFGLSTLKRASSRTQTVPLTGFGVTTDRTSSYHSHNLTAYRQNDYSSQSNNSSATASDPKIKISLSSSISEVLSSLTTASIEEADGLKNSTSGSKTNSGSISPNTSLTQITDLRRISSSESSNSSAISHATVHASALLNLTKSQTAAITGTNSYGMATFLLSTPVSKTSISGHTPLTEGSQHDTVSPTLSIQSLNSTALARMSLNNSITGYKSNENVQLVSLSTSIGNGTASRKALSFTSTISAESISSWIVLTSTLFNLTIAISVSVKTSYPEPSYSASIPSLSIESLRANSSYKVSPMSTTLHLSSHNSSALISNSNSLRPNNSTSIDLHNSSLLNTLNGTFFNPYNSTHKGSQNSTSWSFNATYLERNSTLLRENLTTLRQNFTVLKPQKFTTFTIPSFSNSTFMKTIYDSKTTSEPRNLSSNSSYKNSTLTSLHSSSSMTSIQNATLNLANLTKLNSASNSLFKESGKLSLYSLSLNSTQSGDLPSSYSYNGRYNFSSESLPSSQPKVSNQARILVSEPRNIAAPDLFQAIDDVDPETLFTKRDLPLAKPENVKNDDFPIQTNKFYGNLLVGNQNHVTFTHPYSFYWDGTKHYGYGAQVTRADKVVQGPHADTGGSRYFYNPVFIPDIIFSATTIDAEHSHLTVTDPRAMSVKVNISPEKELGANYIELPLVQGMGMVSAIYHGNLVPRLATSGSIRSFVSEGIADYTPRTTTYRIKYSSGNEWLLFVTVPVAGTPFLLSVQGNQIVGSGSVDGLIIQAAPAAGGQEAGNLDGFYHQSAGKYLTDAQLSGYASGSDASYSIKYESEGTSMFQTPLVFALPHHLETLDPEIKSKFTGIQLPSTTKGTMSLFLTPELKFNENLNLDVQWNPWVEGMGTTISYTGDQVKQIRQSAVSEISDHDIKSTILNIDNGYFRGKALDKYAQILYVLNDVVEDKALTLQLLDVLQKTFDDLREGKVKYPLNFDKTWGGVTSSSAHGHLWDEFGSGLYNDHHFHYGYYIHAAALMARVDKSGEFLRKNKDWINALVKDVANPLDDEHFPESRLFDWYHGHSWAKGLFESQDSKDQESTSEDYHFSYAMKLWGQVTENPAMELRGDLMLQIQKRAMNLYYLLADDNQVMYPFLRKNKVAGILFENKIDYTTYFGTNREYIHGINMLPITPASGIIRGKKFVKEEWEQLLKDLKLQDGWAGILQMNRALYDGKSAYDFFSSPSFDKKYLDGGQSRTWALAYTAAIANAESAQG